MKFNSDTLATQLKRGLPTICLVTGDEPLLLGEACDALRVAARARGFTERQIFNSERGFDWQELRSATQEMSLFAEQRILEVRIGGTGPGNEGGQVLAEIAAQSLPDILLIVVADKLDTRSLSTKWVTAIEQQGWLGHPQYRPGDDNTVAYCHEGPHDLVDARMWFIDEDGRNLRCGRRHDVGEASRGAAPGGCVRRGAARSCRGPAGAPTPASRPDGTPAAPR